MTQARMCIHGRQLTICAICAPAADAAYLARDAEADLWELGQAYIAFHDLCRQDASEAAINAALAHRNELQARIAALLPPEKT